MKVKDKIKELKDAKKITDKEELQLELLRQIVVGLNKYGR